MKKSLEETNKKQNKEILDIDHKSLTGNEKFIIQASNRDFRR